MDRAREVFEEALEVPAGRRREWLAQRCGEDGALRAEVESLLAHDDHAPASFMTPPPSPGMWAGLALAVAAGESGDPVPDPLIGRDVGSYHVESVIAAGGMGTVYLAEQASPRRRVAIKVMRPTGAFAAAARRFEYESRILAHLVHPNIAHIYEAGTFVEADGAPVRPYFVMEHIPDAKTITRHAGERELSHGERLGLFLQACDAVNHGHQKGVIHRDLKPANILVDGGGHVKVIDFGVARATDADLALTTMETEVGQLLGTVQYMSPEQWDADPHAIDTRSDVYSLGVVLYELMCGRPPYELARAPLHRAAVIVREAVPPAPGGLDRALRGDIGHVMLRALEKDPARRYQSVAELAEDIRRYLRGEAVEARRATGWYRVHRWIARRPRALVSTAAGLLLGLLAAGATSGYLLWRLHYRPDRVEVGPDHRVARLLAADGNELHQWKSVPGGIAFGRLVRQPAALGGRVLAVLGGGRWLDDRSPGLYYFDVGSDRHTPFRSLILDEESIPESLRSPKWRAGSFTVNGVVTADVFSGSDHPGEEIVAVYASAYSQRALRIYDTKGSLLFQVWYDGAVGSHMHWMRRERLLVLCGDYASIDDLTLTKLGYDLQPPGRDPQSPPYDLRRQGAYPSVVFAIRPEAGVKTTEFLRLETEYIGKGTVQPVWCRFLLPPAVPTLRIATVREGPPRLAPDSAIEVGIDIVHDAMAAMSLVLTTKGEIIARTAVTDIYKNALERNADFGLPNPEDIRLGTWEEFLASSPNAPDPSGKHRPGTGAASSGE